MIVAPDRIDFTLRELEIFHALIMTGTTIAASQRLGMSQSAVSRSLTQLEASLNRTLFERQGGRLVPTPEALAVNEELGPLFASLSRIVKRATSQHADYRGTLRIAAPPTIAHRFMPSLVARFAKLNPNLEIVFEVLSSDSLVTSVAEARVDLGLTDTNPAHEGVRTELLVATDAICALPSRHRLAARSVIEPEDLEGEPFVAMTRRHSSRIATDRLFDRAGVRRRMIIETATAVSAAEFVREGLGIALLNPFPIVHQFGAGIVVRPFRPILAYRTSFLLPSSLPTSASAAGFMDLARLSLEQQTIPIQTN